MRRAYPLQVTSEPLPRLIDRLAARGSSASTLLTNLRISDLRALSSNLAGQPCLMGFREEVGYWMLLGPAATAAPQQWRSPKARPLGMPALE